MRTILLTLSLFTIITCVQAQVDVSIHMHQKLGAQPFAYNSIVQTAAGYYIKVSRLQYYISEVKLIHDGGQITPVTDSFYLVTPSKDSILELGNFNVTNLESIEYSLGVDPGHNHLDPVSYPSTHPLAPKNPTMHWGWTAGYRFIAFEGFGGATSGTVTNNYQIHTVDDSNYKTVTLPTSGEVEEGHLAIHVSADYLKMFESINAQNGLISHAATGASKKQMENMQSIVFTAENTTSTTSPEFEVTLSMSPNPSNGSIMVSYDLSGYNNTEMLFSDLSGRIVSKRDVPNVTTNYPLQLSIPNGIYLVSITSDAKVIATKRISIQH